VFLLFGAFIVLCGTGHLLSLLTLWVPAYGLEGVVKAATAVVSILTAVALWMLLPKALLLPSHRQMREVTAASSEHEQQALKLSRLNADLQQFAYAASHDLKAPLHAIARLADWISEDIQGSASPETLENLRLMRQRAARLQMLIASLLRYARAGHTETPVEAVDLAELVGDIVASIAPPPGFVVQFRGEIQVVLTQRSPLEHVLRNLISNAIDHHDRAAGEVIVSASLVGGVTEFRVEDDGPGIGAEFHQRIFAIFQTLKRRDESETSGVGLSIVQKIVERAGGKVWIESAPPRRGAAFVFTWPEAPGARP
jgi:signal transduction histidine kinase